MPPRTQPVSRIKAALNDFETFPEGATSICLAALTIAAEGGKADIVKPMRGMGPGVFENALPFRGHDLLPSHFTAVPDRNLLINCATGFSKGRTLAQNPPDEATEPMGNRAGVLVDEPNGDGTGLSGVAPPISQATRAPRGAVTPSARSSLA